MPDPDLIIRTSGEERISNFLLWQMAYSELYFSDVFSFIIFKKELLKALSISTKEEDSESEVVVCDECQGYLNPALAVDAAVRDKFDSTSPQKIPTKSRLKGTTWWIC